MYLTARFLTFLDEFDYTLFEFLYLAFARVKDLGYLAMPKGASVSKVRFYQNWKDAFKDQERNS